MRYQMIQDVHISEPSFLVLARNWKKNKEEDGGKRSSSSNENFPPTNNQRNKTHWMHDMRRWPMTDTT